MRWIVVLALVASRLPAQLPSWGRDSTHAQVAWSRGHTGRGIRVAVLDAGTTPALLAQVHLVGQFNTVLYEDGIAFPNEDSADATDRSTCGTHHGAGTASEVASRDYGVAPDVDLLVVKIAACRGGAVNSYPSEAATGIRWAVAHGARIISLSYSYGFSVNSWLQSEIAAARAAGVLVVVSAGNDGAATLTYPASDPNVLSVAASDPSGAYASFNNRGALLMAPGVNVASLSDNTLGSGSSRAAPYVAGVAALALHAFPALSGDSLRALLLRTASGGIVDAARATQQGCGLGIEGLAVRTYPSATTDSVKVIGHCRWRVSGSNAFVRGAYAVYDVRRNDTVTIQRVGDTLGYPPLAPGFQARSFTVFGQTFYYQLFVPAQYDPSRAYPVVLFVHGSGERGTNNTSQVGVGLGYTVQAQAATFPAVVIFPQMPVQTDGSTTHGMAGLLYYHMILDSVVHEALSVVHADSSRLYMTGVSMGAFDTYSYAYERPTFFAALAPVSGGMVANVAGVEGMVVADNTDAGRAQAAANLAARLRLPIWAWHGDADGNVPIATYEYPIRDAFAARGATNYQLHVGVGRGHELEVNYQDPAFWTWLWAQHQ